MGVNAMSFLLLMIALSALAYVPQWLLGDRKDYRMAMRHGMAGGFVFTGSDHFVHSYSRYVPMLPQFIADYAAELVYFTGAMELAGAIGLVIPLAVYSRLGMPNLRKWAGIGLAVMLAFLVIANIHVALKAAVFKASNSVFGIIICAHFFSQSSCCGRCLFRV